MQIDVHIVDTKTGEHAVYRSDYEELDELKFIWSEGAYACDCNRSLFFNHALGRQDETRLCGHERFLVEKIVERGTEHILYEEKD